MIDLEDRVSRVFNPEVRPLVQEAYRCYTTGAPRDAIVLTWTAVCADLITKAQILKEEGDAAAAAVVADVERAQQAPQPEAVQIMLGVEKTILAVAEQLELLDFTQRVQLERLREDRHLCAHPSLRPLGELFEPTVEYARAHLAVALEAVLIYPPSQGRRIVDAFAAHVADPGFVFDPDYLTYAFFNRGRPSAKAKVVEFAARFAVLQVDDSSIAIGAAQLADRMAGCLRCFAERDADLAQRALSKQMDRLARAEPGVQLAALGRLGTLPAFWSHLPQPLATLYNTRIATLGTVSAGRVGALLPDEARALALVSNAEVRESLPALQTAFASLMVNHRAEVIAVHPDPYFVPHLPAILAGARSYDEGDYLARTAVLPCAGYLTLESLQALLRAWWDNSQCWGRNMPAYLAALYHTTTHLGPARDSVWLSFLEELREFPDQLNVLLTGTGLTLGPPPSQTP
ncbi:hypothetical protein PV726_32270 [Streptomyces europaeiscabiei]|uniref:hypothetical protein n=1 Tax=Streptomyces europaeiscabiei TaxID=146819 RepID=UPI0029B6121A|nr:hypothetical protein [Streptomyces europaeiscabiei]MDX3694933.1 hypothetical protein [Streptomyces europaeiscabiei]